MVYAYIKNAGILPNYYSLNLLCKFHFCRAFGPARAHEIEICEKQAWKCSVDANVRVTQF